MAVTGGVSWNFRLYVAGDAVNSAQALTHLQAMCRGPLAGRCSIDVVDVLSDPQRAVADGVFMAPTLLRLGPAPRCEIVGRLTPSAALVQTLASTEPGAEMPLEPAFPGADPGRQARIAALIETLHETEQALEELTAGEVDTVANRAGHTFLLRSAEERLRRQEANKQMALLNALPAHIAVLDAEGVIVAVNEAWRRFADDNGLRDPHHGVGRNYLDACGPPEGPDAAERRALASGLRAVIAGERSSFSIEYACHSPTEQRWFMLMATPLTPERLAGAVVMHINVSARARAEHALRDSKAMLDMAGRIAKVGGWTFDLEQRRLKWSDMVARLHDEPPGHSPTMELGLAAFVPEHRDGVRDAVERCIRHGVAYDLEAEKISATGRRIWVRTFGEAVRDAQGRIVRIQGALQDITERKVAALQTQQLAQRLGNTLESIADAFFAVDSDWRFSYVNHEAERLWGRQRGTLLGQVLWDVYPEALGTIFEHRYRRAMAGETDLRFEALYPPMQRWFGIECHPLDDGLSVYFRDVTDSRKAGQQLKLLQASVAQLNDIVIICEPAPALPHGLRIVFVNDAFVHRTGFTREEVIGRSPGLLDGPLTDAAELARMRHAVDHLAPVHVELVKYTKDGQTYPVELDITPVAAAGEGFTHFVSVVRDISERRRGEEAMRELHAGLEDRVQHRTLELERARELAEQANRAKSSFLATMSHEIRTPMNGVVGMVEVLEQSPLRADQRDMVKTVRESAYALLTIVDDVLDFSKIEAGEFTIDHAPMDVTTVVEGVGDALRLLSQRQGVGLQILADPRLPRRMRGDAGRLRQVLMNLVGNAIKFSGGQTRPGTVSLHAQRVSDETGTDTLELVVMDNGLGMDAATLARIFSPFTQADASTTRRFGGTGLGLSISHRLVAMMGGAITVSSAVNQGSTFTVRLPVGNTSDAEAVIKRAEAAPEHRPRSGTVPVILVAEDNEVNQQVLGKQLALLGYRAEMAANGVEALARWRCGGHALLLTDLHMPAMDGYTLAAAVRAEESEGARLPIIALTANALRDEELRCRQAGMDAYLTKPVRLAQLKSAIEAWLRRAPTPPCERVVDGESTAESPAVDLGVLADLLGDDPLVMQDVLKAFRASSAGSPAAMAQAHAAGAVKAMCDVAHKLKSGARAIGANRLGQICADIEDATTGAPTDRLETLMSRFETELQAVHRFLDTRQAGVDEAHQKTQHACATPVINDTSASQPHSRNTGAGFEPAPF